MKALWNRVANMVTAGVIMRDRITGGAHRGQIAVHNAEGKDGIRILTPYGFAVRLLPASGDDGPETVVLAVETDLRYALPAADARYQPDDLQPGEACLYTDEDKEGGLRIHLKRGRVVNIICRDAVVQAENIARIEGRDVQIHARERLALDVNGYGWQWLADGEAYHLDNYTTGIVTSQSWPVRPPDITPKDGS